MNEVNPYASPKHDDREPSKEPEISSARLPHDILLSGSMSVHDVLRTQLLILKHRWFYAALTLGIYVAFVIVLGLFTPGDRIFGNTFMVLGLVIMPAILPFTLLMVFLRLQRDAKHKAGIFAVTETRLSNEGIHTNIQQAEGALPWATFSHFLCSPHVILLFLKDSNDHLIVARSKLVHDDDWEVLLHFLNDRFGRERSSL